MSIDRFMIDSSYTGSEGIEQPVYQKTNPIYGLLRELTYLDRVALPRLEVTHHSTPKWCTEPDEE